MAAIMCLRLIMRHLSGRPGDRCDGGPRSEPAHQHGLEVGGMAEKMARGATVLPLIFVCVTVAAFQIVPALGPVAGAQATTSKGSGEWGAATTWSCGGVLTGAHSVKILAGHTVTVSGNGTAAKVTVEGVLKASRAGGSTLTIAGNLIVRP